MALPRVADTDRRRLAILAEGEFGTVASKTAMGVIRYGHRPVVAVIDSTRAGRNVSEWMGERYDIPVVASIDDALRYRPDALLLGTAPPGGRVPPPWRSTIVCALQARLDLISGLHEFLGDDPELAAAAATAAVTITDHRRPPDRLDVATGRAHTLGRKVILTVGTDCALGKMSVALELRAAAVASGLDATFVATGQTGIMIEGWGVAVDRLIGDFLNGTVEWLVEDGERRAEWVFVEGQGSLDHPAYSAVTLGLIHGATPHAMVMVHQPRREYHHGWEGRSPLTRSLPAFIALHEQVAALVAPSVTAAVALNTALLSESEARRAIAETQAETGLATDDPYRFGGERLLDAIRERLS